MTSTLLFLLLILSISTVHSSPSSNLHHLISCLTPGITCTSNNPTRISLPGRRLTGPIPESIGHLPALRELSLPNNQLNGTIPYTISNCLKLEILILRNNHFSGHIPETIASLVRLRVLDLSFNSFSGDLNFLSNLPNLERLSLDSNLFSGRVPVSVSSLKKLVFLDLSNNPQLYSDIPTVRSSLRRSLAGNFTTKKNSTSSARVNGTSTPPAPAPNSTTSHVHEKKHKHRVRNWIIGFVAGSLGGTVSGLLLSVVFRMILNFIKGRYKIKGGPSIFSSIIKNAKDLAFLEHDEALATLEIIGRGGCGEVYKAELQSTPGKIIAIKRITKRTSIGEPTEDESRNLDKWARQIRAEILTVGHIRHRNLLPLLAHKARPDSHFLIYEYMKNGSLHDLIKQSSEGLRELDWSTRLKIARGIAAGLEYLHISHKPNIIHRDLKPANILIDDDMEARIADFGFAKEIPDSNTHMTSSNVAGTYGYIAPEYHQTFKFTVKCDIYSFGVILAVIVMGKFPSDEFFQETEEMSLVRWLQNVMSSGNLSNAIDEKLMGNNGFEQQMLLVLKIACLCTVDDPKSRPDSKDVRLMLTQVQNS